MARVKMLVLLLSLAGLGFGFRSENEKIVDLRITSRVFTDWLEYEVLTKGEQNISLTITHESGKVFHSEDRTLYGEAYLELNTIHFPRGKYNIKATCQSVVAVITIEKV